MSDSQSDDLALSAANYVPPQRVTNNANLEAQVEQMLREKLAALGVVAPVAARVLTAEEAARAALDNAGAGLGVDERLAELYQHVATIAKKVGI